MPSLAVAVRRLHDTSRSGFWLFFGLIPFVGAITLLVFYCLDSTPGGYPQQGYPAPGQGGYPTDAPPYQG